LRDYQAEYLTLFTQRLPRKPYATDDPSRGVRIMYAHNALRKRYIQVGRYPHGVFRLVVDVDQPGEWWWDRAEDLHPSLVLVNPETKRAHVFYELDNPVPVEAASQKSLEFLADAEAMLEAYFGADPGYTGLLARNPVWWREHYPGYVLWGGRLWTLTDLVFWLRRLLPRGWKVEREATGYGRNCTLFDVLRHYAYLHVDAFRRVNDFPGFRSFLDAYAKAQNWNLFHNHPKGPLLDNEIKHIVKSVAGWTWQNYWGRRITLPTSSTGRPDRSRLSRVERAEIPPLSPEEQAKVRQANNEARQREAREKLAAAYQRLLERGAKITVRGLAREAGVSRDVARVWLKELKG